MRTWIVPHRKGRINVTGWIAAIVAGGVALTSLAAAPVSWGQADTTLLVSRQSAADGGAGATGGIFGSGLASISADGRFVAFDSDATNLSSADINGPFHDVFVRDLQTDTTTLVSRQSAADGGAVGDNDSVDPSISADGRFVAFSSRADNLSSEDIANDVFVRDLQTNTTTLVSRQSAADGGVGANDASFGASISADGRFVAFASEADNLSSADNNAFTNVFVRDLQTATTSLVSRQGAADGGAGADGLSDLFSSSTSISADGRFVAFRSDADNLSSADDNFPTNVFVRDLQTHTTTLVSRKSAADGGAGADGSSFHASISADGRSVAFTSNADNLSTADVGFFSSDVFVRDLQTATTSLVSRQSAADGGAGAGGGSFYPSVSADGRFVAFGSIAANLSTADDDFVADVFRRELFSVDATPPETVIDSGPSGPTNDQSPTFTFSADEPGSTFECSIDTGAPAFASCSGPGASHTPASPLADGTYTFRVRATDGAGNTDASPATRSFVVDTAPPETTIDSPTDGSETADPTPGFSGIAGTVAGDELDQVTIEIYQGPSVAGAPFRTLAADPVDATGAYAATPSATQALADGTYTARALQSDAAANTGQSSHNTFTVDTTGTAGNASVDAGVLGFDAAGGVANELIVAPSGSFWRLTDAAAPITAGAGCTQVSVNRVRCPQSAVTSLDIGLGDMNDSAASAAGLDATVDGGAGNDSLTTKDGTDTLLGGSGREVLEGGAGPDTFDGGTERDVVLYHKRTAGQPVAVDIDGVVGDDGGALDDDGTGERDTLLTTVENVRGGAGDDMLTGSAGPNILTGGAGVDQLHGLAGNDQMRANGDGSGDTITCGAGAKDHVFADATDSFTATGPDACEIVN